MEIAVDVRSLMEGRHSGVEEYTTHIIHGMARLAPQHTYRLFYNAARPIALPTFPSSISVHPFRFPNKLLNLSQFLGAWPPWDSLVRADCFFVPHFRLTPLSAQVPLVTTVHDLSFEHFPELFSWRRRLWHGLMRPRRLLQNSDRIIAVSGATKADVVRLYDIPAERVSVVYSGVDVKRQSSAMALAALRESYELPQRFVLYLATLEPRKNVNSIIRAFDAIAGGVPHDLVIAGARGWLTGATERAYHEARHRERIHFLGFIEENDKQALYQAADLFVYPSLYEGFGFPPLEALSAGTPVITSWNSSLPEVVGQWATLIDPYDVAELALVMGELLRDLPTVSEETREAIRRKYSWDRAAQETLAIIEDVV
jgi:glycosyltransferase involved in cell wall biosynthesis